AAQGTRRRSALSRLSTTSDAARWRFPARPFAVGAAAGHSPRRPSSARPRTPSRWWPLRPSRRRPPRARLALSHPAASPAARRARGLLARAHVALLWEPAVADIYPPGDRTRVSVEGLSDVLEGASRPGHYTGVCTVVARLLTAVRPDELWLGQKDAQQAVILERMATDLLMPVRLRRGPTVREEDGLAMSSRNAYLSHAE